MSIKKSLSLLESGIKGGDWGPICEAFRLMTGEKLPQPASKFAEKMNGLEIGRVCYKIPVGLIENAPYNYKGRTKHDAKRECLKVSIVKHDDWADGPVMPALAQYRQEIEKYRLITFHRRSDICFNDLGKAYIHAFIVPAHVNAGGCYGRWRSRQNW